MGTLCVWICACVVGVNICITVYLTSHIIACIGFTHTLLTKIKKCSILYWFLQASITRYSGWQIAFTLWGKPFIFWMTCTAEYLVLYAFQKHATAEKSNSNDTSSRMFSCVIFSENSLISYIFLKDFQWRVLVSHRLSVFQVFFPSLTKNGYGRNSISLENHWNPFTTILLNVLATKEFYWSVTTVVQPTN